MTNYVVAQVKLNSKQKQQIVDGIVRKMPTTLKLSKAQLIEEGDDHIALTQRQINSMVKAGQMKKGVSLSLSLAQLRANKKMGIMKKIISGEGVFSSIFNVAKKIGGVVADKVLVPAGHLAIKLARDVGGEKLGKIAQGACDTLAVAGLAETQPELLPLATAGCSELGGVVKGAIKGDGCCMSCEEPKPKKGRGRPKKST